MTLFGISILFSLFLSVSRSFVPYIYRSLIFSLQRGRRGGGGGGGMRRPAAPSRPAARPASTSARTPAPASKPSSVAAPQKSGGMLSGIGSTIAQGMAFGTGSAIAHQAVGAVMGGGGSSRQEAAPEESGASMGGGMQSGMGQGGQNDQMQGQNMGACANDKTMFYECLNHNKGDQQACHFLYEQLQQCQQSSSQSSSQMQF
jgi:hypothetical protein